MGQNRTAGIVPAEKMDAKDPKVALMDKKLAEILERFINRLEARNKKYIRPAEAIAILTSAIVDNELDPEKENKNG